MRWLIARRSPASPDVRSDARFAVDDDVRVTEANDDGRVILHTKTARLWILNRAGAQIWDRLASGRTIDHIVEDLAAEHDRPAVNVRHDTIVFAEALVSAGLLHARRAPE